VRKTIAELCSECSIASVAISRLRIINSYVGHRKIVLDKAISIQHNLIIKLVPALRGLLRKIVWHLITK
jgi:hypothetical protein